MVTFLTQAKGHIQKLPPSSETTITTLMFELQITDTNRNENYQKQSLVEVTYTKFPDIKRAGNVRKRLHGNKVASTYSTCYDKHQ
jgi:hypothetical protein